MPWNFGGGSTNKADGGSFRFGSFVSAGVVAGALLAANVAQAQTPQPEAEAQRVQDTGAIIEQLRSSAGQGRALLDLDCPTLSFAQVLSSPDDVLLNTCYARQQISEGNVRGAAATLERVLLIAPDRADVRLLYAIVLFRLDSVDEAEREFKTVESQADLPADIAAQVDDYLSEIEQRRKRTKHVVTLAFGTHYDSNRNSAPKNEKQFAGGGLVDIGQSENRPQDDIGLLGVVSYSVTHDLGLEDPHELIGDLSYLVDEQFSRDDVDLHALTAEPGIRFRLPGVTVTPRLHFSVFEFSPEQYNTEKFLTNYGGSIDVGWRTDWANDLYSFSGLGQWLGEANLGALDLNLRGGWVYEKFSNTSDIATLTLRSGSKFSFEQTSEFNITPSHRVGLRLTYENKSASGDSGNNNLETFSNYYYNGALTHVWALGRGMFLASEASIGYRKYPIPDPLILPGKKRIETPRRLRSTLGVPLTEITNLHWLNKRWSVSNAVREFLASSNIAITGEYLWNGSNIDNFQYTNNKLQALLTRRFEF